MKNIRLETQLDSRPPKNGRFYTIAIDGRGGSGKTPLADYLKKLLPEYVFLNGDDYFEPMGNRSEWGSFNDQRFIEDVINPLSHGSTFTYRPYDWHKEPHTSEQLIRIDSGFCLEGRFSFGLPQDWDLKIWVEVPRHIALEQGLSKETMPEERAQKAWEAWQKEEDEYIKKIRPLETADIVIDGTKPFKDQLV